MATSIQTRCCIAGGGPAGMMLAFLLARNGVDVWVFEKHADFLRDFRGDTVHPSTLEVMYELGLLDEFLKRPHQEIRELSGKVGNDSVKIADFAHVPTRCKFVALMPQWEFLDFLAQQGRRYSTFHVSMQAEVLDLLEDHGNVIGVRVKTPEGPLEVHAQLTVGADGRQSLVRDRARLPVIDLGAPIDVLWMRLSRRPTDGVQTFGHIESGKILVLLNRETYWQCAFVIPKGAGNQVRERGLESFRQQIAEMEPALRDRVEELRTWDDVKLLTVEVDRLSRWWRPGLLCIGDAAHAMSPIGGVGINLAIQDAVAAANLLGNKLLRGRISDADLQAVERRRTFPTRATQRLQILIQNRVFKRVLQGSAPVQLPWLFKLLNWWPILRRIPARVVGVGFRPEHVSKKPGDPADTTAL